MEIEEIARYVAVPAYWTMVPEARPVSRVKAAKPTTVIVGADGKLHPEGKIEIDTTFEG